VRRAIAGARLAGHQAIILVGEASFYGRFGFTTAHTGELWMPGRFERDRLLALELRPGALRNVRGLITATGSAPPSPSLEALIANLARDHSATRRAA